MRLLSRPLLLILLFTNTAQQSEVFDVVVTETSKTHISIVWDGGSLRVPQKNWDRFENWPKEVVKGQLLKATYGESRLLSVASCEERAARLKAERQRQMQGIYDRPALNVVWAPEDCNKSPSKFIAELLEKLK